MTTDNGTSFEESVIIPLRDYRKRCIITDDNSDDDPARLLTDTTVPTDRRMKLYAEAISKKRLRKERYDDDNDDDDDNEVAEHIELNFPVKDRPIVRALVEFIHRHRDVIGWRETDNSLVINGRIIPNSNILNVLRYFTSNSRTDSGVYPVGAREYYETLIDLGLPTEWIRRRPAVRASGRSKARKSKRATPAAATPTPTTPLKWSTYT